MTDARIDLRWEGPVRLLRDENLQVDSFPRVTSTYLWTLSSDEKKKWIHYVGYASDLQWRNYEHVKCTLGGQYWLPIFENDTARYSEDDLNFEGSSREHAISRLGRWIGDPDSLRNALEYLRRIEVFYAATASTTDARDAEYLIQRRLMEQKDNFGRAYPGISLRGSRLSRPDRVLHHGGVLAPNAAFEIPGITG